MFLYLEKYNKEKFNQHKNFGTELKDHNCEHIFWNFDILLHILYLFTTRVFIRAEVTLL